MTSFNEFEKTLQETAPQNIDWQVHRNNKNNYMSQPIISIINGIEALFSDIHTNLKADSEISKKGVQAIIDYYDTISKKKYGFKVSAEGSLKALAKSLMDTNSKEALVIYHKTVNLYPNSAYALSSLAKAYADLNNFTEAIKYQTLAVDKAKSMSVWHQNNHKRFLEEYKKEKSN